MSCAFCKVNSVSSYGGCPVEKYHKADMRRSLGMNTFYQKKTTFHPVKYGSLSTSALSVVETASTSVLYTQILWRTRDLHINVVILVFVTTSILLMSALCSLLFAHNSSLKVHILRGSLHLGMRNPGS